jgi:hypothetical protein
MISLVNFLSKLICNIKFHQISLEVNLNAEVNRDNWIVIIFEKKESN